MKMSIGINAIANNLKSTYLRSYYDMIHWQILSMENLRICLLILIAVFYLILFAIFYYFVDVGHYVSVIIKNSRYHVLLVVGLILAFLTITLPVKILSSYYRTRLKKFYPQILSVIGLKYHSATEVHEISETIRNSKLFPIAKQSEEENIFYGEYRGIDISVAETKIFDGTNIKKHPHASFKGIVISLKSDKDVNTQALIKIKTNFSVLKNTFIHFLTLLISIIGFAFVIKSVICAVRGNIMSDYILSLVLGFIIFVIYGFRFVKSVMLKELFHKTNLPKVIIEDKDFPTKYEVYSYDELGTKNVVTSAFCDRLMYLENVYHAKNIRCSFMNENVVIAIEFDKNNFEIGNLSTSLKNPEHINNFLEQIVGVFLIADYLKI